MKKVHLDNQSKLQRTRSRIKQQINTPWRIFAALLTIFILSAAVSGAQAAIISKTNSEDGSADSDSLDRIVVFTETDFVLGSVISDVNISVNFEKISGTCPTHDGGSPFNREIFAYLTS